MSEPLLRFPVICPMCRREELAALPTAYVAAALLQGSAIQLYARCHDVHWNAQPLEVDQLREYLGIAGIPISPNVSTGPPDIALAANGLVGPSSHDGKEARTD
jgi:hypothetical protein